MSLSNPLRLRSCALVVAAAGMSACGGGGGGTPADPPPPEPGLAQRAEAAQRTASTHGACSTQTLGPFYWEIGDRNGVLAGGGIGPGAPTAATSMGIASASKWIYAAYVLQKAGRRAGDVPHLNFTSGYTQMLLPLCQANDTVASCVDGKDGLVAATAGRYLYGSGHMQVHAARTMAIGALDNMGLAAEVGGVLGLAGLGYTQPQLAGGITTDTATYASFLRKLLRGELAMGAALGSDAVCTNPRTCPSALGAPIPDAESWSYALGHWVENDPQVGDGAFSSAGAFGFYPWIDRDRRFYGVLARRAVVEAQAGHLSAVCGRLIRRAWLTGTAVP